MSNLGLALLSLTFLGLLAIVLVQSLSQTRQMKKKDQMILSLLNRLMAGDVQTLRSLQLLETQSTISSNIVSMSDEEEAARYLAAHPELGPDIQTQDDIEQDIAQVLDDLHLFGERGPVE